MEPFVVAEPVLAALGGREPALPVLAHEVVEDRARLEHQLAVVAQERRLPERVDRLERFRREVGLRVALVLDDLVVDAELLEAPEHALRAGVVQVVDFDHGCVDSGLRRGIAGDPRVVHHARHGRVVGSRAVQHAAIVPDREVAGLPAVAQHARRTAREVEQLVEQALGFLRREARNAERVAADEQRAAPRHRVHLHERAQRRLVLVEPVVIVRRRARSRTRRAPASSAASGARRGPRSRSRIDSIERVPRGAHVGPLGLAALLGHDLGGQAATPAPTPACTSCRCASPRCRAGSA